MLLNETCTFTFITSTRSPVFIKAICIFRGDECVDQSKPIGSRLHKKTDGTGGDLSRTFSKRALSSLGESTDCGLSCSCRCAGEPSIFFLSRDLACVNGCAFYSNHVRNSQVLRALATDLARGD